MRRFLKRLAETITGQRRVIDSTGIILTPGNGGRQCRGNGTHASWNGKTIACCCEECDYLMCCTSSEENACAACTDNTCPQKK